MSRGLGDVYKRQGPNGFYPFYPAGNLCILGFHQLIPYSANPPLFAKDKNLYL